MPKAVLLLSRPSRCSGTTSLSYLLSKLSRRGEAYAVSALAQLSPSLSVRIRWIAWGNHLSVGVM